MAAMSRDELLDALSRAYQGIDGLGAQLAEAQALLREVHGGMWPSNPLTIKIGSHLSANAEPSEYLQACKAAHDALAIKPSAPAEPTELQKAVDELSKVPASWQAEFNTRVLCILRILARAQK